MPVEGTLTQSTNYLKRKKATRETRAKQEGTLIQISIGLFAKNEQTKKNWYPANTHNNIIIKGNTVHLAIFPVDFQHRVRPHYTKVVVLSVLFPLWICFEVCAIALKRNWYPTKTQTINTTSKREAQRARERLLSLRGRVGRFLVFEHLAGLKFFFQNRSSF